MPVWPQDQAGPLCPPSLQRGTGAFRKGHDIGSCYTVFVRAGDLTTEDEQEKRERGLRRGHSTGTPSVTPSRAQLGTVQAAPLRPRAERRPPRGHGARLRSQRRLQGSGPLCGDGSQRRPRTVCPGQASWPRCLRAGLWPQDTPCGWEGTSGR